MEDFILIFVLNVNTGEFLYYSSKSSTFYYFRYVKKKLSRLFTPSDPEIPIVKIPSLIVSEEKGKNASNQTYQETKMTILVRTPFNKEICKMILMHLAQQ